MKLYCYQGSSCNFMSGHHSQAVTHLSLLQAAIQLSSGQSGQGHSPLSVPFDTPFQELSSLRSCFCYFASSTSCHFLMIQSLSISCIPSFLFIGIGDHKSSFQSLNKDLACGEIDSYYPVLRKTFHQGKPIISLTVIPFLTGIEATTTK